MIHSSVEEHSLDKRMVGGSSPPGFNSITQQPVIE